MKDKLARSWFLIFFPDHHKTNKSEIINQHYLHLIILMKNHFWYASLHAGFMGK